MMGSIGSRPQGLGTPLRCPVGAGREAVRWALIKLQAK